jgi:CrcB protein
MTWLMVAVGGAAGSLARYGVAQTMGRWNGVAVPYATALVNVVGCGAAGLMLGLIASGHLPLTPARRALIFAGVLGGFTTFSGVGIDTLALVQDGRAGTAATNVILQIAAGLALLAVGYALGRR